MTAAARRRLGLPRLLARLAVAALAVAAACSRGDSVDVPEGFVEGGIDGVLAFAYPAGWKQVPPGTAANSPKLQIEAPEQREGVAVGAVQVFQVSVKAGTDIEAWVGTQLADYQQKLPQFKIVGERAAKAKGAEHAKVVENTYNAVRTGVSIRGFELFTLDGEGNAVTVAVAGTDMDAGLAQRIIDSVRIET